MSSRNLIAASIAVLMALASMGDKATTQQKSDRLAWDSISALTGRVPEPHFAESVVLQVSIVGEEEVPRDAVECSWFANASGGQGTVSYQWYRDGIPVSTQSTYDAPGPFFGSFTLLVEVEDTSSGFDSDSITVDSSPTADSC